MTRLEERQKMVAEGRLTSQQQERLDAFKRSEIERYRREWTAEDGTYTARINSFPMLMVSYIAGIAPEMKASDLMKRVCDYRDELMKLDDELFEAYMEKEKERRRKA